MELRVNLDKRELKAHGTYEFPVNISRKRLSSYGTGSFPWHWHDEVELTLVLSGEIDYRVNDSRYLLKAGEGPFSATRTPSTLAAGWRAARTATMSPSTSPAPAGWGGMRAASSGGSLWTAL